MFVHVDSASDPFHCDTWSTAGIFEVSRKYLGNYNDKIIVFNFKFLYDKSLYKNLKF